MFEVIFFAIALSLGALAFALLIYDFLQSRASKRGIQLKNQRIGLSLPAKSLGESLKSILSKTPFGAFVRKADVKRIKNTYERDLPACLEVVALGMQAGMGFDQAFELYTARFSTPLARKCSESLSIWQKGLKPRDESLRDLADDIGTTSFKHFSVSVLRALRFGSPMAPMLLNLANEARKEYRASRQEMIAKAPVKMLLPTGVLILPAMLLLVMGPIILDLLRKMG